jgi:translation initiation factor 2-alpha kinase 4
LQRFFSDRPTLHGFLKILLDPKDTSLKEIAKHPFLTISEQVDVIPLELEKLVEFSVPPAVDMTYFNALSQRENPSSRYYSDFQELEFLGKGGFGSVVKAKNIIDGRLYAIKRIKINPSDGEHSKRLLREVQTLSRLHSEHIVRYYQAWFEDADNLTPSTDSDSSITSSYTDSSSEYTESEDEQDLTDDWLSSGMSLSLHRMGSLRMRRRRSSGVTTSPPPRSLYTRILYIQMEYCEKKTLRDVIDDGISLDDCWKYFRQLLEGLGHLHAQGIIHRDLKPSNVFLDRTDRVKIGDFGLATARKEGSMARLLHSAESITKSADDLTSEVGTPVYTAPEIMSGIGRYNSKVDMYSMGILFFEMVFPMQTLMQRSVVLRDLRLPEIIFPPEFDFEKLKNPGVIIKNLLNHVPRERWSCMQLLQSPLIPANVEGEYINEDLMRIVRQRNPAYFSRIVIALFGQTTDLHKDFAYDFASNSNTLNYMHTLLSSLVEIHSRKVFHQHGALQVSIPLMIPKSEKVASIYESKRPAEFLDRNGDIVQLNHDLTVPFARSIAQIADDTTVYPLKRFSIDRVYRNNAAGGQPRSVQECDFDIVYQGSDHSLIPEAEVIKTVFEILEFGQNYKYIDVHEYVVRVNYMPNLETILNSIGCPTSLRYPINDILSQLHKPLSWTQAKQALLKLGLEKGVIEKLIGFDNPTLIQPKSKKRLPTLLADVSPKLMLLTANLEHMGISNAVYFDPLLVYNQKVFSSGLVFQITRRVHAKYDVIAAGGRYESLMDIFKGPFEPSSRKWNAVGVNIAFSKYISNMAEHQYRLRIEDSKPYSFCLKADIVVVGLGDTPVIVENKLSIVNELWSNGLSSELSFVTSTAELDAQMADWRSEYMYAIILKPKGHDSFALKVRNLFTKTEVEGTGD